MTVRKADIQLHAGSAAVRRAACLFSLLTAILLWCASSASAESLCTDTWTGPSEGSWQTAADWSGTHVPGSTDVACIGSGKTVSVSSEAEAAVVQGKGALIIEKGGVLDVASSLEPSVLASLSVASGTLTGPAEVAVSKSFTGGGFGTLKGSGSLVLQSGATGTITPTGGSNLDLEERTLKNEGTLTVSSGSGLLGFKHAKVLNSGTLYVNGENHGENHGLIASENEATLLNTGSVKKTEGAGPEPIMFAIENEGSVSASAGQLELTGGGVSGAHATGSWTTSGGASIRFDTSSFVSFNLGAVAPLSGTFEIADGTVAAGKVEGSSAALTISGAGLDAGTLEVTGGVASTLRELTVTNREGRSGGVLAGAGELDVSKSFTGGGFGTLKGSGSLVLQSGATGTITPTGGSNLDLEERTLKNEGTLTVSSGSGLLGFKHAKLLNSGTLYVNGENHGENHGLIASENEATLLNTGSVKKTEGAGPEPIMFAIENEGSVSTTSGELEITGGGVSGIHTTGSWSASGAGTKLRFDAGNSVSFSLGAKVPISGVVELSGGPMSAGVIEGSSASLTISGAGPNPGTLEVTGASPSTLHDLTLTNREERGGGVLDGSAEVDVTGSFKGGGYATERDTGPLVIESGATGSITPTGGSSFYLSASILRNAGTLTVAKGSGLQGEKHAQLINTGTLIVNGETASENHGLIASEKEAVLTNYGTLKKTEGTGITPIEFGIEDYGPIVAETGAFEFRYPIPVREVSTQYGGSENPSAPGQPHPKCGKPVSCATGNESTSQTDLSIGGRGVGLDLTRTYNSQAAAAGASGAFGHGWSSSFSDHLALEPGEKRVTLIQAEGSTVPFSQSGASLIAPTWTQDTLTGSTEAGYTLTYPDQIKLKFSGSTGRLESETDRNGNTTTLGYGGTGRLETITDPASRKITLTYNGEGLIESAKDPIGHVVKYAYEGGNLASVTEPGETEPRWRFKYDGSHQLTELTDGRGGKTINEYNGAHQVVSQTDPLKHVLSFEYEPFETKITNHATGSVTDEHFTSSYEPVSITRGFGTASASTESFSYDSAGNVLSSTDGNGHTSKYTYDASSNRTSLLDADKNETKWTFNATHDVETTTTPNGETTTIERDTHGNAIKVSRPAPGSKTQVTKYKYATHGELESATDPLERTCKYEYNANGDRTAELDPEGDKRTWGYDGDSYQTSSVSPRGHVAGAKESSFTTSIERDAQERAIKVTDALKHVTKYAYDANGNLETETDPLLNLTTYTYDADNRPTAVKEPNATVTETEYDGAGRMIAQSDGNKHTTKYVRNILGEVTEVTDPLGRKTLKEYDAAGNLTKLTDAAKRTTKYSFDPANRLTEVDYSSEATPDVKYEYDADGSRTKMVDGTGTTKYTYDQLDRLTETKDGHGDVVGYEYDLANEQTKITYPSGKSVSRAYDKAGRLESVTDWLEHTSKFAYDADSDLTATTFPASTGNVDQYAYENNDAMESVTMKKGAEVLASLEYTRNKDAQVTKATTKGLPGEEKPAFAYDENSRLTKGAGIKYGYDAADNTTTIGANTYSYDSADQLESSSTSKKALIASYSFDELGERTKTKPSSGPATTYGYDQASDLTSVARPHEGEVAAIEDSYGYDGDGLRASQTISGSTSYMSWDVSAHIPLILNDGTSAFIYGPGGLPIEQISGEAVQYLHHDQQGSTRMLTGSSGTVAATTTFDAYGNKLGSTGTATTALGYDAQYTSADTGLIYLRARVYDPSTAQFIVADPALSVTRAPYNYAGDNPLSYTDPRGLDFGDALESFGEEALDVAAAPLSLAAEGIGDVASLTGIPEAAESAAQFWAGLATSPCSSGAERLLGNVFGPLSELATRRNIGQTTLALIPAAAYGEAARAGYTTGREFEVTDNLRVSPLGNSNADSWAARLPHYHRRITDGFGNTVEGGSMKWHRPWENGP
jgi:RHS repeat-associated protein